MPVLALPFMEEDNLPLSTPISFCSLAASAASEDYIQNDTWFPFMCDAYSSGKESAKWQASPCSFLQATTAYQ